MNKSNNKEKTEETKKTQEVNDENITTVEIINCPICGKNTCYVETYEPMDEPMDSVIPPDMKGYLCKSCGSVSNSEFKKGSKILEQALKTMPNIVKDKKTFVEDLGIYFFLAVVQTRNGHIFPEPDGDSWKWVFMPLVFIPKEDKEKYPIPGKDGEYYEQRLAEEHAERFGKDQFYDALVAIGLEGKK